MQKWITDQLRSLKVALKKGWDDARAGNRLARKMVQYGNGQLYALVYQEVPYGMRTKVLEEVVPCSMPTFYRDLIGLGGKEWVRSQPVAPPPPRNGLYDSPEIATDATGLPSAADYVFINHAAELADDARRESLGVA
jgi:hypothetical protein